MKNHSCDGLSLVKEIDDRLFPSSAKNRSVNWQKKGQIPANRLQQQGRYELFLHLISDLPADNRINNLC